MRYLFSGFGPFRDVVDNPSTRLVRDLAGLADVATVELPTSFERAPRLLSEAIGATVPDRVIMLGWAAGGEGLRVERIARRDSGPETDVDGATAPTREGTELLRPAVDPDAVAAVLGEHARVSLSEDAGGYVCNYLYYHLLAAHPDVPGLFVHASDEPGTDAYAADLAALRALATS